MVDGHLVSGKKIEKKVEGFKKRVKETLDQDKKDTRKFLS